MAKFNRLTYNDSIVEKIPVHLKAREDVDSVAGNSWKLQDTYMSAKFSFRVGNNDNKLSAGTMVDCIPQPLNCWARSFKLSLKGVAMMVAHSNSMEVTNAINLLMEKKPCIPKWLELPWGGWTLQAK